MWRKNEITFSGDEYWDEWERDMCDNPDKDETWRYWDSLCFRKFQNFEEVRIEVLSWSPPLVIYRNFFTKKQVESYLQLLKIQSLEEQEVVDEKGKPFISKVRVANGTVTPFDQYPEAESLLNTASRLIPAIDFSISEDISALSYNPGGHYAVHYDYLEYEEGSDDEFMNEFGNRMATFIMVFKKATSGGGTLFPSFGTVVRADAGDAFLWFDSKENGEMDMNVEHGGCPVYDGQKVISTIWVRSYGQRLFQEHNRNRSFDADVLLRSY
ncbi:hypothetical protein GCK72_025975 [Caenorhabditis remanei]|nr:hypothetical protein GCK72_025975 [Caenorhabditis remanei]KAF1749507.1 hypothetical protein GCK72_025975 [Caenorhabditis remanei]